MNRQRGGLTDDSLTPMVRRFQGPLQKRYLVFLGLGLAAMKIVNSLKTMKKRDKDCRLVRRKGRVYIINKKNPRFKARQG